MANIKSAKKRVKVIAKKTMHNKGIKSSVKTAIKKVVAAINAQDKDLAKAELSNATKAIASATSKGIFHKNTASRKISRLSMAVDKM